MGTYIIGDVQGCYRELQQLLEHIDYHPNRDQLGFVGDLVNRGPDSLAVLRFLKQLPNHPWIVLGNHDLYLLVLGYKLMPIDSYPHTLHAVLAAPDRTELLDWLRHQAIVYYNEKFQAALVHAGIPPQWTIAESLLRAKELQDVLQGPHFQHFLHKMFGNEPAAWRDELEGLARWRYLTNAFTRMRLCTREGQLDLTEHRNAVDHHFKAWFEWRDQRETNDILFGHWAMLGGQCSHPRCFALDTGCAWGESLTAIRLEDKQRFSVLANRIHSRN